MTEICLKVTKKQFFDRNLFLINSFLSKNKELFSIFKMEKKQMLFDRENTPPPGKRSLIVKYRCYERFKVN